MNNTMNRLDISETIALFIEIDVAGADANVEAVQTAIRPALSIAHLGFHRREEEIADSLDEDRLRHLIRGLIRYTKQLGPASSGGSVSPVNKLLLAFAARYPDSEPELTGWIVRNRENPYDPFGTLMHNDATSLEQHKQFRFQRAARR